MQAPVMKRLSEENCLHFSVLPFIKCIVDLFRLNIKRLNIPRGFHLQLSSIKGSAIFACGTSIAIYNGSSLDL